MASRNVTIKGLDGLLKKFADKSEAVARAASNAMADTALAIQADAKAGAPVNMGELRASIRAEGKVHTDPKGVLMTRVAADSPYASWVEFGRGPGKAPPVDVLQRWVHLNRRKLGVKDEDVNSVAFLIGRKIAERGTEPTFFFTNAVEANERTYERQLLKHLKAEIRKGSKT